MIVSKILKDVHQAVRIFAEGARFHHSGVYLTCAEMAFKGILVTNKAVDFIDENSSSGRDVLIPLLDHREDSVRVTAASALLASRPELSLPVIRKIHGTCEKEAQMTAALILISRDVFGDYVLSVCRPDPRYPTPGAENDSTASVGKS